MSANGEIVCGCGLRIDYTGFILVALWRSLEIVLDKGQREDWFQSNFIIVFSAISIVSALIFFSWELRGRTLLSRCGFCFSVSLVFHS